MFNKKNRNFDLSHYKNDIPAGLVVFLVALPLCLGIGQASIPSVDFLGNNLMTPFSGIIAGVIGGLVVTLFSGSRFGVSGPAAGLISIVLVAMTELGFQAF